jgi:CheY-like chemotaxis protein
MTTLSRASAACALKRLHADIKRRLSVATPPAFSPSAASPECIPTAAPAVAGRRTVVVVEDDEATRALIARALSPAFDVVQACTGLGALELLGRIPAPSLIVLDVGLPEIDGVMVARKLKTHPVLKDVPVVFVTARVTPSDVGHGIAAGAKHYLTKPFSVVTLVQVVQKHAK